MAALTIPYSDPSKTPITISTGTIDYTTSLGLVGKNAPGYGPVMAQDFLQLLENFASPIAPNNPVEGQLWYDTSDVTNKKLKINDGAASGNKWYPANGVFQQIFEPTNAKLGDIWVDIAAQQLKIYNGAGWTIIGPSFSITLQTGAYPDSILGTDRVDPHFVIKNFINGEVVSVIAKESFRPVNVIEGFDYIYPGVNLSNTNFQNSNSTEFHGLATSAASLKVTSPTIETVSANNFFRTDISQTLDGSLTINNDGGITIGSINAPNISIKREVNNSVIANLRDSGKILFKTSFAGTTSTIMTMDGANNNIGINVPYPYSTLATLDLRGTLKVSGVTELDSNVNISGNLVTSGSVTARDGVFSTLRVTTSTVTFNTVIPGSPSAFDLGSPTIPWRKVWVEDIGTTSTFFSGTAASSIRLTSPTTFNMVGQVETTLPVAFDGSGILSKVFQTKLTRNAVTDQSTATVAVSTDVIPIVTSAGLQKITKANFLAATGTPPGVITLWSGDSVNPPDGWLFCDGSIVPYDGEFNLLYNEIGQTYWQGGVAPVGQFQLPELPVVPTVGTAISMQYIIKV